MFRYHRKLVAINRTEQNFNKKFKRENCIIPSDAPVDGAALRGRITRNALARALELCFGSVIGAIGIVTAAAAAGGGTCV